MSTTEKIKTESLEDLLTRILDRRRIDENQIMAAMYYSVESDLDGNGNGNGFVLRRHSSVSVVEDVGGTYESALAALAAIPLELSALTVDVSLDARAWFIPWGERGGPTAAGDEDAGGGNIGRTRQWRISADLAQRY